MEKAVGRARKTGFSFFLRLITSYDKLQIFTFLLEKMESERRLFLGGIFGDFAVLALHLQGHLHLKPERRRFFFGVAVDAEPDDTDVVVANVVIIVDVVIVAVVGALRLYGRTLAALPALDAGISRGLSEFWNHSWGNG